MLGGLGAGSLLFVSLGRGHAVTMARQPPPPIRFDVLRDGAVIGAHEVEFGATEGQLDVHTRIDIEVHVLGVKAFEFRHASTEIWENDRLRSFDSETLDDDSRFFVSGRATDAGFQVTRKKGGELAPSDIMVGSYWRPEIARQTLLLDPQRGTLKQQRLIGQDRMALLIGGASVEATRYTVAGLTTGWVAYDEQGRWVSAQVRKRGSDVSYVLRA